MNPDTIPALDDAQLKTLLANARRLQTAGADRQKIAAEELLPVIEAEIAARIAAKPPVKRGRKPAVAKAA